MTHPLRRLGAVLLLIIGPVVAGVAGVAAFFLTAFLTPDPRLLCAGGLATTALVTYAFAGPGWALARRTHRHRYAAGFTVLTAVAVGTLFSLTVLVPGPRPAAGTPPYPISYWQLTTGSRIAYVHRPAAGPAKPYPVVFLHGGPGTPGEGLPAVAADLAADGFDVYAYDQLGAGRSTRLRDVTGYTVARQVADLEAIRAQLGTDRLILVGRSWGASLAAQYLAAHPDRVHKAVFTSPGPIWPAAWPGGGTGDIWAHASPEQLRQRDEVFSSPRVIAQSVLQSIDPNAAHRLVGDDEADELMHRFAVIGKDAGTCPGVAPGPVHGNHQGFYVNQLTVADFAAIPDPRPALRRAGAPALIMRGSCDFVPAPIAREYRDLLPDAELVTVAAAGHALVSEQPQVYSRTLLAFLDGRPRPGKPVA
ncbi:alpha/beta fold hydrolase [Actinoplanes sp. NPDC004185]